MYDSTFSRKAPCESEVQNGGPDFDRMQPVAGLQRKWHRGRLLLILFVASSFGLFGQNDSLQIHTAGGFFDMVYDPTGATYPLHEIFITDQHRAIQTAMTEGCESGYFDLFWEEGSGFELPNDLEHAARRNVLCTLFSNLSEYLISPLSAPGATNKVNIRIKGGTTAFAAAKSYYVLPSYPNLIDGGIADNTVYLTIASGQDPYASAGFLMQSINAFFHGEMEFNFNAAIWHTNLTVGPTSGSHDMYSVALHEAIHMLGFASLIDGSVAGQGNSLVGGSQNYYSRYDLKLKQGPIDEEEPLISTSSNCPMYDNFYSAPFSAVNPNGAIDPNLCVVPNNDLNCQTAVKYMGFQDIEVFTPACFNSGSSLSHFEDYCINLNPLEDNTIYVMSNAIPDGMNKRTPTVKEHRVLGELGYHMNIIYATGTNYEGTYNDPAVEWTGQYGINDGIANGQFTYMAQIGQPLNISVPSLLANDSPGTELMYPEIVIGTGNLNLIGNILQYTPASGGYHLLRYVPFNNSVNEYGNITYVYVYAGDPNCVAECNNLIGNGDFESTIQGNTLPPICSGGNGLVNQLSCWSKYSSSPDVHYGINCYGGVLPSGAGNTNYLYCFASNGVEESVQTQLAVPLIAGETYTLSFIAHKGQSTAPMPIGVFLSDNILAPPSGNAIPPPGTDPNLTLIGYAPLTSGLGWIPETLTFTAPTSGQVLIVGPDFDGGDVTFSGGVRLDNFELVHNVGFEDNFPNCIDGVLTNLEQYVNPPGGVFTGNGIASQSQGGNTIYSFNPANSTNFQIYYTYTDAQNCSYTVELQLLSNPPIAICQNVTVELNSQGSAVINAQQLNNGSSDDCTQNLSFQVQPSSFDCSDLGSENTAILTVMDAQNQISTCQSTITVVDLLPPSAICQENITIELDENGEASIGVVDVDNGSTDNCGIVTWELSDTAFTIADVGPNTVTLTVTDASGNIDTCEAIVTVVAPCEPEALCQDITVALDASGQATITPEQIDNGSNAVCEVVSMTLSDDSFDCTELGPNTVTLTVTGVLNAIAQCTATVTVVDNIAPGVNCLQIPFLVELDALGTGVLDEGFVLANIVASDNCSVVSIEIAQTDFSCVPPGLYPTEIVITDLGGNTTTCVIDVYVTAEPIDFTTALTVTPGAGEAAFLNAVNGQTVSVNASITFEAGVNLIITGSTFVMHCCPMVVMPGAIVQFDDCSFASPCLNTWKGFDVRASGTVNNPIKGSLTLDECGVKHALVAISTGCATCLPTVNAQMHVGGMIKVSDCVFEDNQLAANFFYANEAGVNDPMTFVAFEESQFRWTDEYHARFGTANPLELVRYNEVKGYGFWNCRFKNGITESPVNGGVLQWADRAMAINSRKSVFSIVGTTGDVIGDGIVIPFSYDWANEEIEFDGFRIAVNGNDGRLRIVNNSFDNNQVGVSLLSMVGPDVVDNRLRVGGNAGFDLVTQIVDMEGIVFNRCMAYDIMDNYAEGTEPLHPLSNLSGIRSRGSTSPDEMVYNNILKGLTVGNLANGKNTPANAPQTGLRYVCNKNQDNKHDFLVAEFPNSGITPSVAGLQFMPGDGEFVPDKAAGNEFTSTGFGGLEWQFRNEGALPVSYWAANATNQAPDILFISNVNPSFNSPLNTCDIDWAGMMGEDGNLLLSVYEGHLNEEEALFNTWQTNKYLYLALIDEGDTEALQSEIAFAWSNDTWEMRERLLDISPFVSKTALIDVADRTDVFPHPVALEIFIANPDVLRDHRFIDYLETKANPMPEYMIDILLEAQNQYTFRSVLEDNLARSEASYFHNQRFVLKYLLAHADSNETEISSRLSIQKSLPAEYFLMERMLDQGNTAGALARHASGAVNLGLKGEDEEDWSAMEDWLNLRVALIQEERTWDSLTTAQYNTLDNLVNYWHTYAGQQAMEVMNFYYGTDYFIPPALAGNWTPRSQRMPKSISTDSWLKVYPNPAGSFVNFEIEPTMISGVDQWQLRLYDISGRMVLQETIAGNRPFVTLNVQSYTQGMYLYEAEILGRGTMKGKLDVVK